MYEEGWKCLFAGGGGGGLLASARLLADPALFRELLRALQLRRIGGRRSKRSETERACSDFRTCTVGDCRSKNRCNVTDDLAKIFVFGSCRSQRWT